MAAPAFTFGTLCSGIESASEAFLPLGAECAYVSEIEPYPCAVLADRHGAGKPMRMPAPDEAPDEKTRRARSAAIKTIDRFPRWANRLPNYGDLTQIDPEELPAVDLLVAGFPCQDFSIAGLRQSLAGRRGNLTLYGVGLIHELVRLRRLRSVLLEQVPDILNTKDNAFGALLGGLVGHDAAIASPLKGGRWTNVGVAVGPLGTAAWRVEDAQYSGVAQRRERLFLVASFGDGPDPVEVLLERQGLSRNPPARGEAGEGPTHDLAPSLTASGRGVERTGESRGQDRDDGVLPAAFGGNRTGGGGLTCIPPCPPAIQPPGARTSRPRRRGARALPGREGSRLMPRPSTTRTERVMGEDQRDSSSVADIALTPERSSTETEGH